MSKLPIIYLSFLLLTACNQGSSSESDSRSLSISVDGIVSFGDVAVGTPVYTKIKFKNPTTNSAEVKTSGDSSFYIIDEEINGETSCSASIIPSGKECLFMAVFNPSGVGEKYFTVSFGSQTLSMSGNGITTGLISLLSDSVNFGSYNAGDTKYFDVTISNSGDQPMTFPELSSVSGLSQTSTSCQSVIYPSDSCTISISYKNDTAETFSKILYLSYLGQTVSFTISGITAPLEPYGLVVFSSPPLNMSSGSTISISTEQIKDLYGNIISDGTVATINVNNGLLDNGTSSMTTTSINGYLNFSVTASVSVGSTVTISVNIVNSYGVTNILVN